MELEPVDFDPFAKATPKEKLVLERVDYDPFEDSKARSQEAPNITTQAAVQATPVDTAPLEVTSSPPPSEGRKATLAPSYSVVTEANAQEKSAESPTIPQSTLGAAKSAFPPRLPDPVNIESDKSYSQAFTEWVTSAIESAPRVLAAVPKKVASGIVTLPAESIALGAKVFGNKALEEDAKASAKSIDERIMGASEAGFTPKEKLASDITTALIGGSIGGGLGFAARTARVGSGLAKAGAARSVGATLTGEALGTSAIAGPSTGLQPVVLGADKDQDKASLEERRVFAPVEGAIVGAGLTAALSGAGVGIRKLFSRGEGREPSTVLKEIANELETEAPSNLAVKSPEKAEEVQSTLETAFIAKGDSPEEATQKAKEFLHDPKESGVIDKGLSEAASVYASVVDRMAPIRNLEKDLLGVSGKYREDTPITALMHTDLIREYGAAELLATKGVPTLTPDGGMRINAGTKGLQQIFKDVAEAGGSPEEATKYMQYKRIRRDYDIMQEDLAAKEAARASARTPEEVNAANQLPVRRTGIGLPIEEVDSYLSEASKQPWAKVAEEDFSNYFKGIRGWLVQTKSLAPREAESMAALYGDSYFPAFRKEMIVDETLPRGAKTTTRGKGISSAKGGEDAYVDPLESLYRYTSSVASSAQRNSALNHFADLIEQLPEETWNKIFITPKASYEAQVAGKVKSSDTAAATEVGVEGNLEPISKLANFSFFRDGNRVSLGVKDKDIANTLNSLIPTEDSVLTKVLRPIAQANRWLIVNNPAFIVANAIRDSQTAFLKSQTGMLPVSTHVGGIWRALKNPQSYKDYLVSSGGGTGYVNLSRINTQEAAQEVTRKLAEDSYVPSNTFARIGKGVKDLSTGVFHSFESFNNFVEQLPRFNEYSRTLERGLPESTALTRAQDLTVDFGTRGSNEILHKLNRTTMFLNATLQGTQTAGRMVVKTPKEVVSRALVGVTAPAVALYAYNMAFPEYFDIPEQERHSNWIIMNPDGKGYHKVPMDREMGPIFGGIPMAAMDDLVKSTDGAELVNQASRALLNYVPNVNILPRAAQVYLEVARNKSNFTGKTIESPVFNLTHTPTSERFNEKTSYTARELGKVLDYSPQKVDYILNQLFPGINEAFNYYIGDPIVAKARGLPEKPTQKASQNLLLKRFISSDMSDNLDAVYKLTAAYEDDVGRMRFYGRRDKLTPQQRQDAEVFFKDKTKMAFLRNLDNTSAQLSKASKEALHVFGDVKLSGDEKRKKLDEIEGSKKAIAKRFMDTFKTNASIKQFYGGRYDSSVTKAYTERFLKPTEE